MTSFVSFRSTPTRVCTTWKSEEKKKKKKERGKRKKRGNGTLSFHLAAVANEIKGGKGTKADETSD